MKSCIKITVIACFLSVMLNSCRNTEIHYEPTWVSLKKHPTPQWFMDAKFGIFIHWGVYSVPAWAPPGKYAEWYPHAMYVKGSPTYNYHREHYGDQSEFGYKDFIPMFRAEKWNPDQWAELFERSGARYVVPVGEHHDGFAMWDSELTSWDAMDMGPQRDIIGELAIAVRKRGMKYAPSYHRARNWFYYPHSDEFDTSDPEFSGLYGESHMSNQKAGPDSGNANPSWEFLEDWNERWEEMRDKYQPDFLWFDGMWGLDSAFLEYDKQIMADYYNKSLEWGKEVGINNKGGVFRGGLIPTEIGDWIEGDYMKQDSILKIKWQNPRGIGHSYGYHSVEGTEEYNTVNVLIDELVDIVSKNGNLHLNVGPRADGTIPEIQRDRLLEIGKWLDMNGEAIYGTTYWNTFGEDNIRFTRKGDTVLYAISLNWPGEKISIRSLKDWNETGIESIMMLGSDKKLGWSLTEEGLTIATTAEKPCEHAFAFKIIRRRP
jgi:alpha-L-fucosidase